MTTHAHTEQPRRFGFWRWIWLLLMIGAAFLAWNVRSYWTPVPPAVVLPAEPAWPGLYIAPGVPFTNTMLSAFVAGLLLFGLMIWAIQSHVRSGNQAPTGFWYNAFEAIIEFFWNTTQSAAGKWARRILPFSMTIFLLVLAVNLFKQFPIHETVGYTKVAHGSIQGYATVPWLFGIHLLDGSHPHAAEAATTGEGEAEAAHGEEASEYWHSPEPCESCEIVPTFRGAATDLNFTVALSLITMITVQVFGVWALGPGYFSKFFNLRTIVTKPFFGLMDFIVSLLELISELAKVLSFALRLFGVLFAGTLLLSIVSTLSFSGAQPFVFFVPGLLVGLEVFVGLIQAYVFSTLALTFMSQATVSHHAEEH